MALTIRGAVEHSLVLSKDIWLPECRWLLASLDRRSENVRVPIVIAELEGERGIVVLSTNPRSMVQTSAGDMACRARAERDRGSDCRIEHPRAGIDEIAQIFNLHREVWSDGIFDLATGWCPDMGKYARACRGTRSGVKEPWRSDAVKGFNRSIGEAAG